MNTRVKKIIAGNSGQAMVEFALVAILFFGLIYGAVEFGRLWYYSTHLGNSVRAAARYGAVRPAGTVVADTESYATTEIDAYLPSSGLTSVTTMLYGSDGTPVAGSATHGDTIRVTAQYSFGFLTGSLLAGPPLNIPTSITLTREASANYE
jgi:Flp pilus assembly protein TadG